MLTEYWSRDGQTNAQAAITAYGHSRASEPHGPQSFVGWRQAPAAPIEHTWHCLEAAVDTDPDHPPQMLWLAGQIGKNLTPEAIAAVRAEQDRRAADRPALGQGRLLLAGHVLPPDYNRTGTSSLELKGYYRALLGSAAMLDVVMLGNTRHGNVPSLRQLDAVKSVFKRKALAAVGGINGVNVAASAPYCDFAVPIPSGDFASSYTAVDKGEIRAIRKTLGR